MKNVLRHEIRWHEKHLTLFCFICFGLPYLFYLLTIVYIVLNWNKSLGNATVGDGFIIIGGPGAGTILKRKLNFKH